jgi:hypothetical protein
MLFKRFFAIHSPLPIQRNNMLEELLQHFPGGKLAQVAQTFGYLSQVLELLSSSSFSQDVDAHNALVDALIKILEQSKLKS